MKTFKDLYRKVIGDKHEDVMAKFGAILAQGIIDAGKKMVLTLVANKKQIFCLHSTPVFCKYS